MLTAAGHTCSNRNWARKPESLPSRSIAARAEESLLSIHFSTLNLAKPILDAIAQEGYDTPTPIQAQAIPPVMGVGVSFPA